MKKTLALLTLIIPIVIIIIVAVWISKKEQEIQNNNFQKLAESNLGVVSNYSKSFFEDVKSSIENDLLSLDTNNDNIRTYISKQPLIKNLFLIQKDGKILYPDILNESVSKREQSFLEQYRSFLDNRSLLFNQQASSESESSSSKFSRKSLKVEDQQSNWHTEFWQNDLEFIIYLKKSPNLVIGVELVRARLLADFFIYLEQQNIVPINKQDQIILANASEQKMFVWNTLDHQAKAEIVSTLNLSEPLTAWKLQYISKQKHSFSFFLNIFLTAILFILIIALLAYGTYYYYKKDLNDAKNRVSFVNQVSHEIKTPLTNISLYAELLEQSVESEESKVNQYSNIISQEAQRLGRLINNVLAFSKSDQKRLSLQTRTENIQELIQEVLMQFKPRLDQDDFEIKYNHQGSEEFSVDRDKFQQILGNLVSNVIKYAAVGKYMEVNSKVQEDKLYIEVIDHGPGIDKKLAKKVFDPFVRGSDDITEGVSGSGIGLSIVKDLVELMGGKIKLESDSSGSKFKFWMQA